MPFPFSMFPGLLTLLIAGNLGYLQFLDSSMVFYTRVKTVEETEKDSVHNDSSIFSFLIIWD